MLADATKAAFFPDLVKLCCNRPIVGYPSVSARFRARLTAAEKSARRISRNDSSTVSGETQIIKAEGLPFLSNNQFSLAGEFSPEFPSLFEVFCGEVIHIYPSEALQPTKASEMSDKLNYRASIR